MKALQVHSGLSYAINPEASETTQEKKKTKDLDAKAHRAISLSLGDEVMRELAEETIAMALWNKLEGMYFKKSLANRLYLKKSLFIIHIEEDKYLRKQMDDSIKSFLISRTLTSKLMRNIMPYCC